MGNQLAWSKRYELGIESIDNGHKKLFRIINRLFDMEKEEMKSRWVCKEAVKYFKDYTDQHFLDEEAYMESVGYVGYEMHKRIHKSFRETTLVALERELERTEYLKEAIEHFLGVCAGWMIGHTMMEDQAIVSGKMPKHWEHLAPEEGQAVMEQSIASQLNTMFELQPELISNCYGGEKFGNGIYYRLIYKTRAQKIWDFLLVFEEKLIISTIGSVIETESATMNAMLMNATRYMARQIVDNMKDHFPSLWGSELEAEQLLSYEQFYNIFEKSSPQYSLLFDTGKGYLAYCMSTTDTVSHEEGAANILEDAISKVQKYVKQNDAENAAIKAKKKLLVVDDSEFMRKVMKDLFSKDYEVMTASSGMSAFRIITLTRPDLILLDYEMPVCRGDQVLEMIRSEKEFADIPVIFLSSKADRESVKSVVNFKPQGYLSKALKPEQIKEQVDHFFQKMGCANS